MAGSPDGKKRIVFMGSSEFAIPALAQLSRAHQEVNNPDLVLFVGEALVGNDGVDQLVKFHRFAAVLSCASHRRAPKSFKKIRSS